RDTSSLRVKTHLKRALEITAKASLHLTRPDTARGTILRDLFKEVVMRVEEERHARHETIDIQTRVNAPLHILDAVTQSERELLHRRRPRFTNVIAAHRYRVITRHVFSAEAERIDHQLHRRFDRIDPFFLRDV